MKKGDICTLLYAIGVTVLIAFKWDEFKSLGLNEMGDFFAGAVGPLALIWLVFGYKQQGEELKLGTKALEIQAQELRNSVDQQSKMVLAQEESLKNYERSLEPILKLTCVDAGWDEDDFFCKLTVENLGDYCEHIVFKILMESRRVRSRKLDPLFTGQSADQWVRALDEWGEFTVVISYVVRSGRRNSQSFKITAERDDDGSGYCYSIQKNSFLSPDESQV